ncbi:hypothetical protein [Alkalihalobacterium elongatum]|uniref:hypothetical protein n=1 Tax=Alkalihalobacterium elongatum TaxID=2675466 RepID=UPI001C1FB844|nr:hypothetical protein [Alkalihalobacterium elongatum]
MPAYWRQGWRASNKWPALSTRWMDRSDLEPMAPVARQVEKRRRLVSGVGTGALRMR